MLILAKRYWRDVGLRSSTIPLCSTGWLRRVLRRPETLTNPRASPQPADREKSPWVTQPSVTREQWELTLGRGSGHSPNTRSEQGEEDDLASSDVVGIGSEGEGRSDTLSSVLSEDWEVAADFLELFFRDLILLLKWSLWGGSLGSLLPRSVFSSFRSSAVGTHTMAWSSGLPFDSSVRRTHTTLIPWAVRNDLIAERSRGGTSPTRHGLWPLDVEGLHQPESSLTDFRFLGSK